MICEKCGIPFGITFEKDKICPVCHYDNEKVISGKMECPNCDSEIDHTYFSYKLEQFVCIECYNNNDKMS